MSLKSITAVLTDPEADRIAIDAARALAFREKAHLDVHCIGIDPTRYEPLPAGGATVLLDSGVEQAQAQANDLRDWADTQLRGTLDSYGVNSKVVAQLGFDRIIAQLTRYCDLAVAPTPYGAGHSALQAMSIEALLFGASVPVLMVPDGTPDLPEFNRIALAWNESDEALRAARRALPLLRKASAVDVVVIDPPSHSPERSEPGGQISLWLARHGVKCEVSILSKSLPRVSDVLLRFMDDRNSDLLVMGAYGHSRFREALLGGATRDIMEETDKPVYLSH